MKRRQTVGENSNKFLTKLPCECSSGSESGMTSTKGRKSVVYVLAYVYVRFYLCLRAYVETRVVKI